MHGLAVRRARNCGVRDQNGRQIIPNPRGFAGKRDNKVCFARRWLGGGLKTELTAQSAKLR